jgi:hypothetical protein
MLKSPLLIGGCPRSGTTALLQVLNSNPHTFISSEENLLSLAEGLTKSFNTQQRRKASLKNGMRSLSGRETLTVDNIHRHNFTADAVWPVIRSLYKWHASRVNPESELILWGDKYPKYFENLAGVLKLPRVRYIHITRHPLDVINSMLRRTAEAAEGRDWWKAIVKFDDMLEAWSVAYMAVEAVAEQKNVLHIHYEDLVFKFSETMASINAFTGTELSFDNILIDEPSLHFDRAYLDREKSDIIRLHPTVQLYFRNRPQAPG